MIELYKTIGNYDTTNLMKIVSNQTENDWNKFTERQKLFPVHSSTITLPILFDLNYSRNVGEKTEWYSLYENEILKIEKQLQLIYKSAGKILRFIIVNLPAGVSFETIDILLRRVIKTPSHMILFYLLKGGLAKIRGWVVLWIGGDWLCVSVEKSHDIYV